MIIFLILFIYILGYLACYYGSKLVQIKILKEEWTWEEVSALIKISFLSWIGVIFITVMAVVEFIDNIEERDGKPPKWL